MATTSKISSTEGSGKNIATYSITEDAMTKELQRSVLIDSTGSEKATSSNPLQVSLANTGANSTAVKVDGSAVTQPVSISGTVNTSATQSGTWNTNATPKPSTSGGLTIYRLLSAATTNGNNIKASAGQVYGWFIYNNTASAKFVKLYNKATAPTVGADTPVMTIPIPANGGTNVEFSMGIAFATGIGIGITGAIGDSDTTAVAANDVTINLFYN